MTKRGNWGDWAVIHGDKTPTRVSCKACVFYNKEDKSCYKKAVYVPNNGYDYWRRCDEFVLDREYTELANEECRRIMATTEYKAREGRVYKQKYKGWY